MYDSNILFNWHFFENFIVNLSLYFSAVYIFIRSLKLKIDYKIYLLLLLAAIALTTCVCLISQYHFFYAQFLFIILISSSSVLVNQGKHHNAFFIAIISIGICHCIKIFDIFTIGLVFGMMGFSEVVLMENVLVAVFQIIFSILFMKIKRFRNGFQFFEAKENLGLGLFLSGIIVVATCIDFQQKQITSDILFISFGILLISTISLIIWIRRSITKHYKKMLNNKGIEYYQTLLKEKEQYIEQISKSNEYLAKIVHRDNHLLSMVHHMIQQYQKMNHQGQKEQMMNEMLAMLEERSELVRKEQIDAKVLPSTGVHIIDGALGDMYIKAAAHNIRFDLVADEPIYDLVDYIISPTELVTLLCDHIKDAIIAIESAENITGKILVAITVVENTYQISIQDNGVDFDIATLLKLGLERVTTYGASGGSGIGFMTTFDTLRKTHASLMITEYDQKHPFSKSVMFRFDGKSQFIIKTNRKDEILPLVDRKDLIIL